jgi:hypothetical protein
MLNSETARREPIVLEREKKRLTRPGRVGDVWLLFLLLGICSAEASVAVVPVRESERLRFTSSSGIVLSKRSLHKSGVDGVLIIGEEIEDGPLVAVVEADPVGGIDTCPVADSPGDLPVCRLLLEEV